MHAVHRDGHCEKPGVMTRRSCRARSPRAPYRMGSPHHQARVRLYRRSRGAVRALTRQRSGRGPSTHCIHPPLVPSQSSITRAPVGSVLPAGTVAQRFGRDLLVVVLHLLSNPSCRREVGASWTDVAIESALWLRGLVVPRPRWLVWLPVRCLWGIWHVRWHSWVVTAACTSTCL